MRDSLSGYKEQINKITSFYACTGIIIQKIMPRGKSYETTYYVPYFGYIDNESGRANFPSWTWGLMPLGHGFGASRFYLTYP